MRDIAPVLAGWLDARQPFALATVVAVEGSAPRGPGAAMAVSATGETVGSVSGGCVEGAVYALGEQVLSTGEPVLERYGISDDDAFAVGLTCGGVLDVLVRRIDGGDSRDRAAPAVGAVLEALADDRPVAVATRLDTAEAVAVFPDRVVGSLGAVGIDVAVADDARGLLAQGMTVVRHYGPHGERRQDEVGVFVQAFTPPPRMLVFGAIDFAAAVARIGRFLGYSVTVCDARPVFATRRRFPDAHEVVCEWPHDFLARTATDERTVICVLTHDPKFDVPLLEVALRRPAAYIGAMGSRRTHADRLLRLRERGLGEGELGRLASPIGLDIGARTPEETAVSIAAEIVQARWGGTGRPLSETTGRIHGAPGGLAGQRQGRSSGSSTSSTTWTT